MQKGGGLNRREQLFCSTKQTGKDFHLSFFAATAAAIQSSVARATSPVYLVAPMAQRKWRWGCQTGYMDVVKRFAAWNLSKGLTSLVFSVATAALMSVLFLCAER